MTPRRGRTRCIQDERGAIALVAAVLSAALFAMVGLVIDGQRQLSAQQRADAVAAEAARTAGQEIAGPVIAGAPGIHRSRALTAARRYLDATGTAGQVTIQGMTIVVATVVTERSTLLQLVDIPELRATGHATVEVVTGL